MARFIDEEYDGIIIRLPSIFIHQNNLEPILSNFKDQLVENSKFSLLLPDYENTLYELENLKEKKEIVKRLKEEEVKRKKSIEDLYQKYVDKELIPFKWISKTINYNEIEHITFADEEDFSIWNFLSEKYEGKKVKNISKKFLSEISERIWKEFLTEEDYNNFVKNNQCFLHPLSSCSWSKFKKFCRLPSNSFYITNRGIGCFRIEVMQLEWYVNNTTYYSPTVPLASDILKFKDEEINLNDYEVYPTYLKKISK
jgi:hypothetical protein